MRRLVVSNLPDGNITYEKFKVGNRSDCLYLSDKSGIKLIEK